MTCFASFFFGLLIYFAIALLQFIVHLAVDHWRLSRPLSTTEWRARMRKLGIGGK